MRDLISKVEEFHETFGIEIGEKFSLDVLNNRMKRIEEEYKELQCAAQEIRNELDTLGFVTKEAAAHFLSESVDLIYVTVGTSVTFGLPMEEATEEIHDANMRKLDEEGKPLVRDDGKILKPEGWTPADVVQFI